MRIKSSTQRRTQTQIKYNGMAYYYVVLWHTMFNANDTANQQRNYCRLPTQRIAGAHGRTNISVITIPNT